jgi:putative chitinase
MLAPRGRDDYLAHLAGPGKAELDKAGILQSKLRLCHFLAQIAHESGGFTVKEESLNYKTSKRLMQVWPKRFPTVASTKPFLGQPTKLGDKVYGGRMGNKDPGDGFKYRGRGYLQTTGRDAYKKFGDLIDEDLEDNPSLVAEPEISLRCAVRRMGREQGQQTGRRRRPSNRDQIGQWRLDRPFRAQAMARQGQRVV